MEFIGSVICIFMPRKNFVSFPKIDRGSMYIIVSDSIANAAKYKKQICNLAKS